ncbi:unnamed protein product [Soboliphyme baturini]|uniref:Uncharacterized protein n=1 Tax=Soboliphyme baturini TaxID=241478 RepID=A0A183JAG3_9BILA|nr:unnamed protein product [Soboliphyme baturini]
MLTVQQFAMAYYDCGNDINNDFGLRGRSIKALERRRRLRSLLSWTDMSRWCNWAFAERQRWVTSWSSSVTVDLPCDAFSPVLPENGTRRLASTSRPCFCRPLTSTSDRIQQNNGFWRSLCEFALWCGSSHGCCDFGFHLPSVVPYCSSTSQLYGRRWRRRYSADECRRFKLAQALNYTSLGDTFTSPTSENNHLRYLDRLRLVRGLGCKTNRSLNFVTIDSDKYRWFFSQFGFTDPRETELFIYDGKNEAVFALADQFSLESFTRFVYKYTTGSLPSLRRTERPPSSPPLLDSQLPAREYMTPAKVYITKLTSQSFDSVVFRSSKVRYRDCFADLT